MQKFLQYILPFEAPPSFPDKAVGALYEEWDKPSRQVQISASTCLTSLLYVIFTFLDKSWVPGHIQALMMRVHLFVLVPMLLTISFLAHKKRYYRFAVLALAVYPVIAISCHAYIARKLTTYAPFLVEGYLGVIWVFNISGLPFKHALVSAIVSSIILVISAYFFMTDTDIYTMHVFWIFCSFSFGCLGALIFDRSRKAVFYNQQELHRLAITDPLTGAFNRNQLSNVLSLEIGRGQRYGASFGCLMIDIDHFKRINDTYGHDAGDKVLQKTAQTIAQYIRDSDTLIRWGGEEFVLVVLAVEEQRLIKFCDKLRKAVEDVHHKNVGSVTVSVGATLLKLDDTQETILCRADKALYEAKASGRNTTSYAK